MRRSRKRKRSSLDEQPPPPPAPSSSSSSSSSSDQEAIEVDGVKATVFSTELLVWIDVPSPKFDFARAADSYGYLYLAPNKWDKERCELSRPLYLDSGGESVALVTITQARGSRRQLVVTLSRDGDLPKEIDNWRVMTRQVVRMLRIDESGFEEVYWNRSRGGTDASAPGWATARGFGRTFRSPSLWEDLVKTVTNTNIKFRTPKDSDGNEGFSTIGFNRRLCACLGTRHGAFPLPLHVSRASEAQLKKLKLGYRTKRLVELAKRIGLDAQRGARKGGGRTAEARTSARFDLHRIERLGREASTLQWFPGDDEKSARCVELKAILRTEIRALPGVGEFGTENLMMLLGIYDAMPLDSETERLFTHLSCKSNSDGKGKGKDSGSAKNKGKGKGAKMIRKRPSHHEKEQIYDADARRVYSSWDKKSRGKLLKLVATYFRKRFPTCAWQAYWFALWTELYVPCAQSSSPF